MNETSYKPRNDMVLIRVVDKGTYRGVMIPQFSEEGKENIVVAVGPKVWNLNPGDKVLVIGTPGEDFAFLPRDPSLFITKESNVVLVIQEPESVLGEGA